MSPLSHISHTVFLPQVNLVSDSENFKPSEGEKRCWPYQAMLNFNMVQDLRKFTGHGFSACYVRLEKVV